MKKKIEFDANARCGAKPDHHPTGWIPVPDDLYERIPTHHVNGQCESVKRFHVTLSPVEDPVQVAQICQDLKSLLSKVEMNYVRRGIISDIKDIIMRNSPDLEAKHTPQTGVKKEG